MENIQKAKKTFEASKYQVSEGIYHDKKVLWIWFPYNLELKQHLKENTKTYWSSSQKAWYVTDNYYNRTLFGLTLPLTGSEVLSKIHSNNQDEFRRYQDMLVLKGFSVNTMRTYSVEFAQLLYTLGRFPVTELTPEKLQSYFLYCIKELKLSENQIHSRINAIKFYFEKILHKERMFFDIPRPKKHQILPKSLNTNEIKRLFEVTDNMKHKLILELCYGMGLRVSEIVNLKIEDIDSQRMKVLVSRGKGKKDRYVNLPQSVLEELREYYKAYRPQKYLFEGQYGGQYSIRSAQVVFKNAMKKAGINKTIGIHGLRHSYATHLLEFGTDISFIQKLLGHNDIKTTLLYTRVADKQIEAVQSPLDRMSF